MKKIVFAYIVAMFVGMMPALAQHKEGGLVWYTELAKAQEQSKATHRPIFGFFTGSDWCGWCHKLQNDVFSKPEFVKWANEKVILLELDFPRRKQLPAEIVQQNNGLQQAFQVRGYPTVWYFTMDPDPKSGQMLITALGSQGYPAGSEPGKEQVTFLNEANSILSKAKK
jgi:thioredoxin-related protein